MAEPFSFSFQPLADFLARRQDPEHQAKEDLKNWQRTGGEIRPDTIRWLQLNHPDQLARIQSEETIENTLRKIFQGKEVTTPGMFTEDEVRQSIQPLLPAPAQQVDSFQLAPPPTDPMTPGREFKLPYYKPDMPLITLPDLMPQEFTQGFYNTGGELNQPKFLDQSIKMLATPTKKMVAPSQTDQMLGILKLQQMGASKEIIDMLIKQLSGVGKAAEDFTLGAGQERFTGAGKKIAGVSPTAKEPAEWQWKIKTLEDAGKTDVEILHELYLNKKDKLTGDVGEFVNLYNREPTSPDEFLGYLKKKAGATRAPDKADKPDKAPYRPPNYASNIKNGLAAIKAGRTQDEVFAMLAQQYPQYQNEIKGIIWPTRGQDTMALLEAIYKKE